MPLIKASNVSARKKAQPVATIDRLAIARDLESLDVDTRIAAIRLAARFGEAELLTRHLAAETDPVLRETLLTSLVRIGGVRAARPLIALLATDDASLRNAVIETLQSMGEEVLPEIEAQLENQDSDLRIYAVNMLLSFRSPRVPDIALRVIAQDPHVNVCAAAVDVLAEVGRPEMVEALQAAAARFSDQPFLSFAVRAAAKRIG
ncbi:HEAT repeat domain-containing protein [Lichenifustis flavocetrariae]|uniref:HEAT repeat domain-containing protein n=1 Tax=Lichenifustis flavocetrariae TaxID=2949735 RepID=A0AA42CLG2_9HYPH|nr:HEAT repeat domain-containing protein [Lichenifustis flavocetrariae]MCW6511553.1 HEAT repeat domain-containing protein [Lichenifustis flavocetrariae]